MADPFTGEIRIFTFNFAPENWAFCNGNQVSLQQYQVLYSIIQNRFGPSNPNAFSLPNLQGSAPVGMGQGTGLSPYTLGQTAGVATVALTQQQMPNHNHTIQTVTTSQQPNILPTPVAGAKLGVALTSANGGGSYSVLEGFAPPPVTAVTTTFAPTALSPVGGGQPLSNQQPYLALNYCICMNGVYPPNPN